MWDELDDPRLTDLEQDILFLLAEGHSKIWIEAQLGISRATLYRNLEVIRYKLRAENNTHAVAIALQAGLNTSPTKHADTVGKSQPQSTLPSSSRPPWSRLTRREKEIFVLLADVEASQKTNGQLARQLQIAEGTLKKHLYHIYHKPGVANRSSAALLATQAKQDSQRA